MGPRVGCRHGTFAAPALCDEGHQHTLQHLDFFGGVLDVVTRIGPNQFAIITHQPDISHCGEASYRRIHDGVNLKAIKTSAGFVSLKAALTIAACDEDALAPSPEALMELAQAQVNRAIDTSAIVAVRWTGAPQTA